MRVELHLHMRRFSFDKSSAFFANFRKISVPYASIRHSASAAVVIRTRVDDFTPVKIAVIERADQNFRSRNVRRNRNIMNIAHTKQIVFVFIVSEIRRGAAEIQQNVNFVVGNTGSYLLRTPVFAG